MTPTRQKSLLAERVALLTPREREAYHFMSSGTPTPEMATNLGIKANTAANLRNKVNRKIGYLATWRLPR